MLSLALIVKNEENNLKRVLDSAAGLYDELVIVDTGSTDKTVEIARSYTDKVFHFDWIKHFAKARNFAFSKCTQPWVMWLDADDYLKAEDVKKIRQFFLEHKDDPQLDYMLFNYFYWVEPPTPEGQIQATQLRERIIRKEKAVWQGRCHEIVPIYWERSICIPDVGVYHLRSAEDRQADGDRNIELMKLAAEEDPTSRSFFYLGNEYMDRGYGKKARESYLKAFNKQDNIDTCFQSAYKIAKIYHIDGNLPKANYWYKRSLEYQVDYREPLLGLGEIAFQNNDFSKAAFWYESSLNIAEPKHPVMVITKENYSWLPHDRLAKCFFKLGQFDKAKEHLEKLFELTRQTGILNDIGLTIQKKKEDYKRPTSTTRLNLGSGGKGIPGFINCDLFPQPGVDEIFSMEEIPYIDKSVDEISSEHALEHLPRPLAEKAIREFARVLKPGGKLNLKVPDLEDCCRKFLENPHLQESWYMHTLYGIQDYRDTPTAPFKDKVNYGQIHYTGFTESRMRRLLTEAGFVIDRMYKYDGWSTPSLAVEAHIPGANADGKKIAFINNSLNPRYLSYGDHWEDAFRANGHQLSLYRYEQIANLSPGHDYYFFIEANGRYPVASIPDVHPTILYTQEDSPEAELKKFDIIATPNGSYYAKWKALGLNVLLIPNREHIKQIPQLLDQKSETPASKCVSIIIPSYKNCAYLRQAIESVKRNTKNYELIVVNSGDDEETRAYLTEESKQGNLTLIDTKERRSFSQAVNRGLRWVQERSNNDVVILNNDVIVGKNWLQPLQDSPFDITNPLSNCDMGWIHTQEIIVDQPTIRVNLHPNMSLGDVDFETMLEQEGRSGLVSRNQPYHSWVAFYATYVRHSVLDATGYLDETFVNGGEDYDFCRRAVKQGFTCGHNFASWVFHYGGKTRKVSENENYEQHHKEDEYNNAIMRAKEKPTICIYTGPAWERWTINSINTTGIGGSETCAAMLAREFVKRGYRSVLIGDCEGQEGVIDGVEYLNHTRWDEFKEANYIDYLISSRCVRPLAHSIKNGKNYVWSHDIFIPEMMYRHPEHSEKVNKFICLSPWHVQFFSQHHQVPTSQIFIQGNGLDLSRYDNYANVEKDPYRLFYSSSPDRGLLTLLKQFAVLKKEFPKLNLHVYYGFFNWKSAIEQRKNPQELEHLRQIEEFMKQDGVYYHDRVSQKVLAEEQMKASLWVYPTEFTETCCITAAEAMLAGAVPVCTTLAALSSTVPDGCGVKVQKPDECLKATATLLQHPKMQERFRAKGREFVLQNCGWSKVADNWIQMFKQT